MRTTAVQPDVDEAIDVARGHLYYFLAAALADPVSGHFQKALERNTQTVALAAAELLASEAPAAAELAPGELPPAQLDLAALVESLTRPPEEIIREHQELFGLLIGKTAPPYETEYCRSTLTFYRAQQLADIAGFYRAFGLEPNREEPERQDHISVELEFMAHLIGKELRAAHEPGLEEQAQVCRQAQAKFLEAHLGWWAPAFAELLRRGSGGGHYAALARALACFIPGERLILGIRPAPDLAAPKTEPEPAGENQCCGRMPCE